MLWKLGLKVSELMLMFWSPAFNDTLQSAFAQFGRRSMGQLKDERTGLGQTLNIESIKE